jgi:hypothetical protein
MFNRRHYSNIATHRVVREQANFLNCVPDVPAQLDNVPVASGTTFNEKIARRNLVQTIDQLERGCLSRATPAQQDQNLSSVNFEIKITQNFASVWDLIRNAAKFESRSTHIV